MKLKEALEERKYRPGIDQEPRIAVLFLGILRPGQFETEWLVVNEKKEDVLKKAGCLSFAGAETAKVVPGEHGGIVENVQATALGSLSEEIFGEFSDDEEIGMRLTMLGDYWYLRDQGVLAQIATVSFDRYDFEVHASDGETENPQWRTAHELKEEENWRVGMSGLVELLPSLAYLHEMIFQCKEEGDGWFKWRVNGETLRAFREYRAQYPDTKHAPFSMTDHTSRKGIQQAASTSQTVNGYDIGIHNNSFCLKDESGRISTDIPVVITDDRGYAGQVIVEFNTLGIPTQASIGAIL